jgi:hypothetical protein
MAKIEKPQAIARLAEIIEVSDAVMVARAAGIRSCSAARESRSTGNSRA